MTIHTCYESNKYRYDFDTLSGVGWFVRKQDDHVSLMSTGIEAFEEKKRFMIMNNRKRCINVDADEADELFDSIADAGQYSPRWGDD